MTITKILLMTSLCSVSISSFALDLVEAYDRAKKNDPAWQANVYQFEADKLNLGLATGNLLPTVTVSGNITRNHQSTKQTDFDGFEGSEAFSNALVSDTSTQKRIAVNARQPLFRMDAWEGYKQVKTSVLLSEVTLKLQKQQHVFNVAQAYFEVLRQQSLTAAYLQEEKALLEQLNMMNAKLKEGLVARSDVSEADAQYQNARANRIGGQVQLMLAQEKLSQFIGQSQNEKLAVLSDDFQFQKPYPSAVEDWINLAQSQNLAIQQARLQRQYAQDGQRVEKAALYPQIEAVAAYGYTKQTPETLISNDGKFDQIGVEMNWNIFSGGRTRTSIKKAAVETSKAQAELDAAQRNANVEVKQAFMQVQTDQAKLQARKAALDSAELVSRASKASYNEGLKTMVDVLLAQRNAFNAKQDYLNAQYDYILNVLKLKSAVGQLTENDLVELNQWLSYKS